MVMEHTYVQGISLHFDAAEREAAELVSGACARTAELLHQLWGLRTPPGCQVYVMTSWHGFVYQSAPWPWKMILLLTFPLWASRYKALWPMSGGWQLSFGRRQAVGIKPPRLIQAADSSIGDRIFLRDSDVYDRVRGVTCHELTHAFTAGLRLPAWLKEGVAMFAADRFFGRSTVKRETLETLGQLTTQTRLRGGRKLHVHNPDDLVYTYVRGYWLVRYFEETRPGLMAELLSHRSSQQLLEAQIAASYGKSAQDYWHGINQALIAHFQEKTGSVFPGM